MEEQIQDAGCRERIPRLLERTSPKGSTPCAGEFGEFVFGPPHCGANNFGMHGAMEGAAAGLAWRVWADRVRGMKRLSVGMAALILWMAAVPGMGQGTFLFSNSIQGRTVLVTDCEGKTLSGANYQVQVLAKDPKTGRFESGLERVQTNGTWVAVQPLPLLEGKAAGIFYGGTTRVPFVAAGQDATLLLRVWDSTTGRDYESATAKGETELVIKLGGVGNPPTFPARLRGFAGIRVCPKK